MAGVDSDGTLANTRLLRPLLLLFDQTCKIGVLSWDYATVNCREVASILVWRWNARHSVAFQEQRVLLFEECCRAKHRLPDPEGCTHTHTTLKQCR